MDPSIIVAVISLAGSIILAVLNHHLQQRMKMEEEQGRQTKERVQQQGDQLAQQQKAINTLVEYAMSASIFRHLCGITLFRNYDLDFHETNRRELYFLRDHGFIQPKQGGFLDFPATDRKHNLVEIAEPTPIGRSYVSLRKQEIPMEMRNDVKNLRVDLSTL